MGKGDIFLVSELSRLGRNLIEVMSILHDCMEKDVKVFATKDGYKLSNNINSKVLTFAFSLSAEIERNLISQITKEALTRKKGESMRLGRPKGSQNKELKLTGKEDNIKKLLDKKVAVAAIAIMLNVNRLTVRSFIKIRKIG